MQEQGALTYCPICGMEVHPASEPCRNCDPDLDDSYDLGKGLTPEGKQFNPYEAYCNGLITHKSMSKAVKRFHLQGILDYAKAVKLTIGTVIYHISARNADGSPERWRVNGMVKTWKTRPGHFEIPLKYGLKGFGYLTHDNSDFFRLTEEKALKPL